MGSGSIHNVLLQQLYNRLLGCASNDFGPDRVRSLVA